MNLKKSILWYLLIGIIGICLFIFTLFYDDYDSFWNGLAMGFIFVSVFRLYLIFKYKNDESYAKKTDIEVNDERNRFLANKAKGLAFYVYILISGCLVIIFKICNLDLISQVLAYSICVLLFLYVIFYFIMKKLY